MSDYYDALERRDPVMREAALFARLPAVIAAALEAPGWQQQLGSVDPAGITNRAALARLPVLRKSDLPGLQRQALPFGGLVPGPIGDFGRLFTSPGPIFEPEANGRDNWYAARAFFAAGFRRGDIVLNTLSYHLTPGGFIADSGARALGCPVIPAGPGNTEQQLDLIEAFRPVGYVGVPDFLNIILDAAAARGRDAGCIRKALVSGAAFPRSLQESFAARGIAAYQAYATADIGFIAFETEARDGMVVNEGMILEVVRPGTGDPVPDGEVGEIVVTTLDPHHPQIRLALGDLTAALPGLSPCGRTNGRIRGWLGRADQTAKVRGMFVRPEQIAQIAQRHKSVGRLRLVVTRENESDAMTLLVEKAGLVEKTEQVESAAGDAELADAVAATLQAITKLRGSVEVVAPGSLPNDGKVIADERPVG